MKKLLLIATGLISIGIYSKNKFQNVKRSIKQLQVKVAGIHNVKMNWQKFVITGAVDLELTNPTQTGIWLKTAGAIKITKIVFYSNVTNKTIGTASTEISGIAIASQTSKRIDNIKFEIPAGQLLSNLGVFDNTELLGIELTITLFGKPYTIN